jgi:hypothetical protein
MTHVLKLIFYILLILITSFSVKADCNFNSSKHLEELSNPKNIKKIKIEIPKSSKYAINFYKVIASNSDNIPPELRKTFRAKITVFYKFGKCIYKSKIRQHGDWKDHIDEKKGMRSLKINLKEGNILNSVKFRLLLPETRGNLNEILGALLLKKLDFISPETFEVITEINGVVGKMLFQEDIQKELLEKNNRREGPIFEGDESLLWSKKRHHNEFENLMLSRLTNTNWFNKSKSTQNITLSSYSKLQKQYLEYSQNITLRNKILIFPNKQKTNIFEDYLFILLAMNGKHGLKPHNRKYYYNSFLDSFEPVYYDGNLSLLIKTDDPNILQYGFRKNYKFKKIQKISNDEFIEELFKDYKKRLISIEEEKIIFFQKAILQIIINSNSIQKLIDNTLKEKYTNQTYESNRIKYFETLNKSKINQTVIKSIKQKDEKFLVLDELNQSHTLLKNDILNIISKNNFNKERYIFIPDSENNLEVEKLNHIKELGGSIIYSEKLNMNIDYNHKVINISQNFSKDWILFKNLNLKDWTINFRGINKSKNENLSQRLNNHGMTGCLNFYKVKFDDTIISGKKGLCEDTVNIVNSSGNLKEILVEKAASDALDIDFSDISLDYVNISKAGNDCVDLSSGKYFIKNLILSVCQDKGVSVGEKSNFIANKVYIQNSNIGISSKDESISKIQDAKFKNIKYCYEVAKKKQEFGGAKILFNSIFCEADFIKDKNSTVNILQNEF